MTEHRIDVEQGSEYAGETYIRCFHDPGGRDVATFTGDSLDELLAFLREHGALDDEVFRAYLGANPAAFHAFAERDRRINSGWWRDMLRREARIQGQRWP